MLGPEAYQRAIARLPDDRRHEVLTLGMFSWCRTTTAAQLMIELAHEAGREVDGFTANVVREGFGTIMRTVWRVLMRNASDQAIVQRAATIYTRAIDRGSARAVVEAPGHLALEITDWPDIHHIDMVAISAGIEAGLDAVGRKARVVFKRVGAGSVRFDVRTAPAELTQAR